MPEEIEKLLKQTTEDVREAKKTLEELANEVAALADIVGPALEKQIQALRSARMTTVTEIQQALGSLREIRKFFLEEDFNKEMQRLEQFVKLCREIKELKDLGLFDAVADTLLKLAVR